VIVNSLLDFGFVSQFDFWIDNAIMAEAEVIEVDNTAESETNDDDGNL
jgi:hypothetical protein